MIRVAGAALGALLWADGDAMKGTADLGGQGEPDWTGRRAAAAAGPSAGSAPDVTGTWAVSVETAAGSGTPTFVLRQEGGRSLVPIPASLARRR